MVRRFKLPGLLLVASLALAGGCSDDKPTQGGTEPEPDAGTGARADAGETPDEPDANASDDSDAGEDAGEPASPDSGAPCTARPDHSAIINAPTDTESVARDPVLPLLNADGSLPPLP